MSLQTELQKDTNPNDLDTSKTQDPNLVIAIKDLKISTLSLVIAIFSFVVGVLALLQVAQLDTKNRVVQSYFNSIEYLGNTKDKQYGELTMLAIVNLTKEEQVGWLRFIQVNKYKELNQIIQFAIDADTYGMNNSILARLHDICQQKQHRQCIKDLEKWLETQDYKQLKKESLSKTGKGKEGDETREKLPDQLPGKTSIEIDTKKQLEKGGSHWIFIGMTYPGAKNALNPEKLLSIETEELAKIEQGYDSLRNEGKVLYEKPKRGKIYTLSEDMNLRDKMSPAPKEYGKIIGVLSKGTKIKIDKIDSRCTSVPDTANCKRSVWAKISLADSQ
ncbi:MAG: hypothetical protein AB4062_11510 [Crocosphaera sp.]